MEFREGINKKVIEMKDKKSHENLEDLSKMKKSVAFFQANSWLENSTKSGEFKNGI